MSQISFLKSVKLSKGGYSKCLQLYHQVKKNNLMTFPSFGQRERERPWEQGWGFHLR